VGEGERNHLWNCGFVKWFQIPCEMVAPKNLLEISHRDGESGHDDVKTCLESGVESSQSHGFRTDGSVVSLRHIYPNLPGEREKDRQVENFSGHRIGGNASSD
jgi:hypothetical protein